VEGIALLRGAVDLAAAYRLTRIELRARSNLANQLWSDDPRAAQVVAMETREIARAMGHGDQYRWITWMTAFSLTAFGDLDWPLDVADEFDSADAAPEDQENVLATRALVAAFRGDHAAAADLYAAAMAAAPDVSRPGFLAGRAFDRSQLAALAGRYEEAYDAAIEAATLELTIGAAVHAMRVAVQLRDPARGRRALDLVEAAPERGRWAGATRRACHASQAALDGRLDGVTPTFLGAIATLRELDITLELALVELDFATLVEPADPAAQAAADEARAIFERMDSPPLLERLREGLERWTSGEAHEAGHATAGEGVVPTAGASRHD
jgi:hypothetical protein